MKNNNNVDKPLESAPRVEEAIKQIKIPLLKAEKDPMSHIELELMNRIDEAFKQAQEEGFKGDFKQWLDTQSSEENDVLKDAKFNQNYITIVPKVKKTNNEGRGFVSIYEDGPGFMATQEMNILTNFIQTIENKGIEYVKDLQFQFYVRNPEKQKTSLKIIHAYSILYSKNIKD